MKTNLSQQLIDYINAGYSCFYLHTAEIARAENLLANVAQQLNFQVLEYNLAQGKVDFKNKFQQEDNQGRLETSLQKLFDEDLEQRLILIKNAKIALENQPLAIARLQHLIEKIERHYQGECAIVLQSAEVYIPADLEPFITLLEMPLPQENEIKALIKQQYTNLDDVFLSPFATALSGLNENEIQKLLTLIHNRFKQINEQNQPQVLAEILYQKEQIIAKSGVLEMVKVNENINDIGGLENLKKWLNEQSDILSHLEEAKAFGVKAPKGALIAGMPGCGKSLTAKATAQLFQQPLLRLDIGSLLGKYVGESETNMRKALAMAESISPCVLWVDELEKAFVGMTGNNASEVSSRLLGYFLTWLQEKTKPVFIIATANDITALPPELLRKGRFDEIFYVGFPNQTERKKILDIHLTKAKQKAAEFNLNELAQLCRDYAGADIENAIYESVKSAFLSPEKRLTQDKIKQAIKNTVPLRKTLKDKVGEYEKKFDELYLTPASNNDGLSIAQMVKMAKDPNYLERKKVAENEEVTEDILEDLVVDKELEVRKAAFANPSCPTKLLDAQISLKSDHTLYNKAIFEIIVKHTNVSFPLAVKICKDTNSYIDELVKNADLSLEENQMALLENAYTREILVKQPYLFPLIQKQLSNDTAWRIREELAKNLKLFDDTQMKLAKDSDLDVRRTLAKNLNITEKVQLILAEDSNGNIKEELAQNPNITEKVQIILAEKDGGSLAQNPNITEKVQLILAEKHVYSLAGNPNIIEKVQLILAEKYGSSLAGNPNITEKVQILLANKLDKYDIQYLAKNRSLCKKAQKIIFNKARRIYVIKNLSSNPNLSPEIKKMIENREYICATDIYKNSDGSYEKVAIKEISVAVGDKVKKSQCLAMHEYRDYSYGQIGFLIANQLANQFNNSYSTREIKSPCEGTVEKILREVGSKDDIFSIIMIIKKDATNEF